MTSDKRVEEWKKLARKLLAPNVTYIDPKFKEVASWAEELLNAFWTEQQKDLDAFITTLLTQYHQDMMSEVVEWLDTEDHLTGLVGPADMFFPGQRVIRVDQLKEYLSNLSK